MEREKTLKEIERSAILESLKRHRWNRTRTRKELDINVRTLRNKINEYRLLGFYIGPSCGNCRDTTDDN